MKRITIYALLVSVLAACNSPKKLMQSGNYDAAIYKTVNKLKRNKTKEKRILILEESYRKANDRDKDKINFLKKEGTPDNWESIFNVYSGMKTRQELVKPLLPLRINSMNREASFEILNYDEEIIQAKQKAAEYLYTHALTLLEKNDKMSARQAYGELMQVKNYYSAYKDVDVQLNKALGMGTSYVLFRMQNATGVPLPPNFEAELDKISLTELNTQWLVYHTTATKGINYDYTILVNMKNIDVSPERVKENNFQETKEVPDGFQYVLDSRGNVKKDSTGKDMKTPKTKVISCNVIETYQSKKAMIGGTLDYVNNYTGQLIKTDPIAAENSFEYRSSTAIGDLNALKPETKANIGKRPVPFPSNFDMIFQAGQTLKDMVKKIIWSHKGVLI